MPKPSYAEVIKERNELREKLEVKAASVGPGVNEELLKLKARNEALQDQITELSKRPAQENSDDDIRALTERISELEGQLAQAQAQETQVAETPILTRAAEAAVAYVDGILNSCCKSKAGRRVCPGDNRCGTLKEAVRPVRQALGMEASKVWNPQAGATPRQMVDGNWPTKMDHTNPQHMRLAQGGRSTQHGNFMPPEAMNVPRPNPPAQPVTVPPQVE